MKHFLTKRNIIWSLVVLIAIGIVFIPPYIRHTRYMNLADSAMNRLIENGYVETEIGRHSYDKELSINSYKVLGYKKVNENEGVLPIVVFDIELHSDRQEKIPEDKIKKLYEASCKALGNGLREQHILELSDVSLVLKTPDEQYSYVAEVFERIKGDAINAAKRGINDNDKGYAWAIAEREVKKNLKSPGTAKFPTYNSATIERNGNLYTVKGYVDAENSYGAKLRSNFTVTFEKISDTSYKNVSVDIE